MRARVPVLSKGRFGTHHPIQLLGGLGCGAEHEQITYRETIGLRNGRGGAHGKWLTFQYKVLENSVIYCLESHFG